MHISLIIINAPDNYNTQKALHLVYNAENLKGQWIKSIYIVILCFLNDSWLHSLTLIVFFLKNTKYKEPATSQ